jgi:hypothetical protein
MLKKEKINYLIEKNNGVLKTAEIDKIDVSGTYLFEYIRTNGLEKVSKGIYIRPDMWEDTMYLMQLRYSQIIFSHETALYLLDMAEREPLKYTLTVQAHYHSKSLCEQNVKIYTTKKEFYNIGITEKKTPMGNTVRCYNAERTLCDIVRNRNNTDKQDLTEALKTYVKRQDKNIPQLMRYAKYFRVEKVMRQYLEVLL